MELDRLAVEQVRGRSLSDHWPAHAIPASTRVVVTADVGGHRRRMREFSAVISPMGAPDLVEHAQARPGRLAYRVVFDEPERDSAGDGPYRMAFIWDRYIQIEGRLISGVGQRT
jgi:hypothetical protein